MRKNSCALESGLKSSGFIHPILIVLPYNNGIQPAVHFHQEHHHRVYGIKGCRVAAVRSRRLQDVESSHEYDTTCALALAKRTTSFSC